MWPGFIKNPGLVIEIVGGFDIRERDLGYRRRIRNQFKNLFTS
jgi:hypothetical protein